MNQQPAVDPSNESDNAMALLIARFARSRGVEGFGARVGDPITSMWQPLAEAGVLHPGLAFAEWASTEGLGGVVPPILANSPDVGALIERLRRFHPIIAGGRIVIATQRESTSMSVSLEAFDGAPAHADSVDAFFSMLCRLTRQLTTEEASANRIMLRRSRPADPTSYRNAFGDVVFAAERDLCTFNEAALCARIIGADPVVLSVLEPYAERRVAEQNRTSAFVAAFVAAELAEPPSLSSVARALALSPRSLQLQLADERTTFSGIVDDVQRERALALLTSSDLSITAIATVVGFSTPAGFTRAVRRWTGQSPTDYRNTASARGTGT